MNIRTTGLACAMVLAAAAAPSLAATTWDAPARPAVPKASATCASFDTLSVTANLAAGFTNGIPAIPEAGETYTISVAGPGTGSFRIVGDAAGTVSFAGPASVPGTLVYTIPSGPLPVGTQGVGFYFDSGAGDVTISAVCSASPVAVPASSLGTQWLLGGLLLIAGGFWVARMRGSAA